MNKRNMSKISIVVESIIIILGLLYSGLQLYYGILYHISPLKYIMNILVVFVIYAGLTYLYWNPWKIHRIPEEKCKGDVLKYSLHMIQAVKLIFVGGLLVPCICDVISFELKKGYSAVVIVLIIFVGMYYECRIIRALKK